MTPTLTPLTDQDRLRFSKHRGAQLAHVPASFWRWLAGQDWSAQRYPAELDYAQRRLAADAAQPLRMVNRDTGDVQTITPAALARACRRQPK